MNTLPPRNEPEATWLRFLPALLAVFLAIFPVHGIAATPPLISYHPYSQVVDEGQNVYLGAFATGDPAPTLAWLRLPAGTDTWVNLTDDGVYSGTQSTACYVNVATLAMSGDQFRCVATNESGISMSMVASLTVNPAVAPQITNLPSTVTVDYGEPISLDPNISGSYPVTYQWKKDGVALTDGTGSAYGKANATYADAGQYTLTATNVAGTATSSSCTVSVNAAVAPLFTNLPTTVALNYGQSLSLSPSLSGSRPMTFQWKKDGVPVPSVTSDSYYDDYATTADNGVYTLTATNLVGTATSSAYTVSVNAAERPAIANLTTTVALDYGQSFGIYPSISGTQPMTFQWKKDGVALPDASAGSYYDSYVTTADAGQYTLTVTNLVETVTSSPVALTVNAAVLPVITNLPATATVNYGEYLNLYPSVSGTQPMTFQWKKDGVAIANASSSSFSKYYLTTTDSGDYTLTATNLVGAVTSSTCKVTVAAAVVPVITNLPAAANVNYGEYLNLYPTLGGTQPMTFQWKKDGAAIAGASDSSYAKSPATTADSGVYTLTATNLAGSVTSSNCTVTVNAAVAPVITNLSTTATVNYGEYLSLYPTINGTQPITFQWKKDGVAIAGATYSSYSKNGMTTADSGIYTLTATNLVGAVTSLNCTVTVNAAVGPVISPLPAAATISYGEYLSLYPSISGTQPMTFQWKKDGVAITGATYSSYSKSGMTTADIGVYTLTATNLVGSVTSSNCTVTVNAAVGPAITNLSATVTVNYGEYLNLYPSVSGTQPMTFQWKKDGVAIAGATYSSYSKSSVTTADGGVYTLTATNLVGAVTSSNCTVTVNAAVGPVISGLPATATLNYGDYLNLYPSVSGTQPITFQWKKDGVVVANATYSSYSKSGMTTADSGVYTLTATNLVGTVTSSNCTVTVNAVIAPAITQQPVSVSVAKGYSANFSVNASGSPSLLFQWYKGGLAISGANGSYYSISTVAAADSGLYTVKVTNDGGNVTSAAAELTVLPAELPKVTGWYGQTALSSGYPYLNLSANVSGTAPITYQWFKDGVAIPGATSSSYYDSSATAASAGNYTLQLLNEAGMAISPDAVVTWDSNSTSKPWLDAIQQGNIVYLLANSPGRIMRYDLSTESWLPIVYLTEAKVPTAFFPTAEGVFIAYGSALVRRTMDLQTEVPVATTGSEINTLFAYGSLIYCQNGTNVLTYNLTSLVAGPSFSGTYSQSNGTGRPIFSSTAATGYVRGSKFSVAPDGTFSSSVSSPYYYDFTAGTRQYLSSDETQLIDNSGVAYKTSDLTYTGSLGRPLDDLILLADGTPVALRGERLTMHGGAGFAETGAYQLAARGFALFRKDNALFVFGTAPTSTTNPAVVKVASSALVPPPIAMPASPLNKIFTIDDAFIDSNAVLHFLSRSEQGIVRWDTKNKSYLPTLGLRGRPFCSSYAPAVDRLALMYSDGTLSDVFPGSTEATEQVFGYVPIQNHPFSVVAMDDLAVLNIRDASSSGDKRIVIGSAGELKFLSASSYWGTAQAWQSATRRLYSLRQFYNDGVEYANVPTTGILPTAATGAASPVTLPLRFGADGALILTGNQRVLNADLQEIGTLANSVTDGVWLPNSLLTVRPRPNGTEVQQWARITCVKTGSLLLAGIPLRIFQVDANTVAVVTLVNGYAAVSLVSADLSLISYSVNVVTLSGAPVITTQPLSQSMPAGSAVALSVVASGTPTPTYQWRKNGVNISGATNSTLGIATAWVDTIGDYSVVITSSAGVAISNNATLTISTTETGAVPAGFDAAGYLTRYPDVAAVFGSNHYAAWLYYRDHGIYQGEVFDELFRVNEYLTLYPELAAIFGSDLGAALDHWLSTGRIEGKLGRIPIEFSAQGYFARNVDVATAVNNDALLAWGHYWLYGIYEGRAYDDELRVFEYLAINADLTAAFVNDWRTAALHWMRYGRTEGRLGRLPLTFNVTEYLNRSPDVAAVWGTNPTTVFLHYWLYGLDEARTYDDLFLPNDYLALNPDIAAVIGTDRRGAFKHWVRYGQSEGRPGRLP